MPAPTTFELFPELPFELRRMIWYYSLRPCLPHEFHLRMNGKKTAEFRTYNRIPKRLRRRLMRPRFDSAVLHVNQESRTVTLENCMKWARGFVPFYQFVNFKDDTFTFDMAEVDMPPGNDGRLLRYDSGAKSIHMSREDMSRMRTVALVISGEWRGGNSVHRWVDMWLPGFTGLRELLIDAKQINFDDAMVKDFMDLMDYSIASTGRLLQDEGDTWRAPKFRVRILGAHNFCSFSC